MSSEKGLRFSIVNLIVSPTREWSVLRGANVSQRRLMLGYLLPMMILIGISVIAGTYLTTERGAYSMNYVISRFLMYEIGVYGTLHLTALVASMLTRVRFKRLFVMLSYSAVTAIILLCVSLIFPFLSLILVLGVHSIYLFFVGVRTLIDAKRRVSVAMMTLLVGTVLTCVIFFSLNKLLTAIFV